ncbi:hypothetical protein [Komagataeibacter saccharivorans]|uniref:hypothetical protein n=1 Tax=Komagataeibacter saccharivorans TaxID=265959 RepID=UPI000C81E82D|nr:hypothetical protein [Komagataeibacter saccharivorans]
MTEKNPFKRAILRRKDARIEFSIFQTEAKAAILAAGNELSGFDTLRKHCSFYVTIDNPDTVQAWFGGRSMFTKDHEGKLAIETGSCLLYSFSAGDTVVSLYPCSSSLAKVAEDQLYIRIGRYSAVQLLERVKSDMRLMIAYGYVSSFDATPTWRQWLQIAWLRRFKPSQIEGKFVAGGSTLINSSLKSAFRLAILSTFTAIMRPVGYIVIALLLIHYGKDAWIDFFKAR